MSEAIAELGPIDYVLIEWPDRQPSGEGVPILIDLVDRGIIRILDLTFITKGEDGAVAGLDGGQLVAGGRIPARAVLDGLDEVEANSQGKRRGSRCHV